MNGLPGMRGVKVGYRSCGCGPADGVYGPDACLGGYHRGCAGARLPEQSAAQRAARPGALHRRKRAAGAVGLSSEGRAHRQRRLPVHRYAIPPRAARRPRSSGPRFTAPTRRAAPASRSRRRCSTASRPPTRPARRRARFPARAKRCGCSSRRCCCRPPPSTWIICATPPSSRFRRATSAFSNRR